MLGVIRNPANDRQRRTRDLMYSAAMAGAASAVGGARRALQGTPAPSLPRGMTNQIVRATHEPKNLDLQATGTFPGSSSWGFALMNQITQGAGGSQRTGRQIALESLEVRLLMQTDPTSLSDDVIRLVIFVDRECRGANPVQTDVFQLTGFPGVVELMSPFNFDNVPTRFKILEDQTLVLPTRTSPTTTTSNTTLVPFVRHYKLRQKVHYFNTSTGTIADIDSGSIYIAWLSLTPTKVSSWTLNSRIVFRDL